MALLSILQVMKDKLMKKPAVGATDTPAVPTTATQEMMQPMRDPSQQKKRRPPAGVASAHQMLSSKMTGGLL